MNEAGPGKANTGLHYLLPRGVVDIEGNVDSAKGFVVSISRHNEGDAMRRYLLLQHSSPFHEDVSTFTVNEKGLLNEAVNVSSASKTGAIINNLTDTAINVATIAARAGGLPAPSTNAKSLDDAEPPPEVVFKPFKVSFDPFNPAEVRKAVRTVADANFHLAVESTGSPDRSKARESEMVRGELDRGGVFYHPLTQVRVNLHGISKAAAIDLHQNVPVPDLSALAVFNLRRGVLITKVSNLTVADGEPRVMVHNKPSEVLAATQIPLDVTTKLVAALPSVGDLFFPRQLSATSKTTAETANLKAQQDLAAQQLATLQAKQALDDSRKGKSPLANSPANEAAAALATSSLTMRAIKNQAAAEERAKTEQVTKTNAESQAKAAQDQQNRDNLEQRVKALEAKPASP